MKTRHVTRTNRPIKGLVAFVRAAAMKSFAAVFEAVAFDIEDQQGVVILGQQVGQALAGLQRVVHEAQVAVANALNAAADRIEKTTQVLNRTIGGGVAIG